MSTSANPTRAHRTVALVGMGGLGNPAALALGAAGVGHLVLLDDDSVDGSNLQRQILFAQSDIGQKKVDAAKQSLLARWPTLRVTALGERVTANNAARLLAGCSVVIDGTDDASAKFLLNDICLGLGVPLVSAGAVAWRGQLMVVLPEGPCLRCLFEAPPDDPATCALAGILGAWAGVVGAEAAALAIAILDGEPVCRDYVALDGWLETRRHVTFSRRSDCPACVGAAPVRLPDSLSGAPVMAKVRIPTLLRKYTAGAEEVVAEGKTVGALLADLEARHPGIKERIFDDKGAVRRFVNIFVRDEDIRFLQQLETAVADNDEISIVPAIAGG